MAHHLRLVARRKGVAPPGIKLSPRVIVVCVDEDAATEVREGLRGEGYSCSSRPAEIRDGSAVADVVLVTAWRAP